MCARAQTVGSHPAQHVRSPGANRQHEQDRGAGLCETDLKQRDRVVPSKDWICCLRSHLHTQHEQHLSESAVCFLRVPPQSQSVREGVPGWVLEQGEGARNWGQQLLVHGAARRTVD